MSDMKDKPTKKISEKTALKYEAAYLRKQIRQAQNLLKQRKAVKALQIQLEEMRERVEHPERYTWEENR